MKILILSNEVWNDRINGNNVLSNWFGGMNADFANIYASSDVPYNKCCRRYFQITDKMMLNSFIKWKKAGQELPIQNYDCTQEEPVAEEAPQKLYSFLKSISGPFLRFVREELWLMGRYDLTRMQQFIDDFQPDVIFSERMASCKMLRLEKIVSQLSDAPMFAFTGDDEYSLKQLSISPFFWINRFMIRKRLRQNVKNYKIYYMLSEEQAEYYEKMFGCKCKLLYKCGEFKEKFSEHTVGNPIQMIYAGKFYCNRWKMLGNIVDVLREINKDTVRIVLEIYTTDKLTRRQKELLNDGRNSFIRTAVSPTELVERYHNADIALHVESLDIKNRLLTKFSFSTKIIDCIFSGCAVMAYCWDRHSGLTYLKKRGAAICVSNIKELKSTLLLVCSEPKIINQYAYRAYECGNLYHQRARIQEQLLRDFEKGHGKNESIRA